MSDSKQQPESHGTGNAFLDGIFALFGGASHQPLKRISISDPVKAIVKTALGSFAGAWGETKVEVEFNTEAANISEEGEKLARQIEAQGDVDVAKIGAEAEAAAKKGSTHPQAGE
jgi:hypothetical protein